MRLLSALVVVTFLTTAIHANQHQDCSRATRGIQNIPGLLLWFTPENLPAGANGTPVGLWPDCSANGFDAIQTSPARQPVLQTNAIAGYPVVKFDGIDDVLKLTGNALLHDISLFIVYRYQAVVGSDCEHTYPFSLGGDLNSTGQYWGIETLSPCSGSSTDVADVYAGFGNDARATLTGISAAGTINQLTAISTGFIHSTVVSVNGQAAVMTPEGSSVPLDVPLSGNPGASWNGIGGGTYPGDNKAAAVEIAEILLFDTALTTPQRRRVERYLAAKYELPGN